MERGARVRLIQGIRDRIQPLPWEDEDLLLEEFGIGSRGTQHLDGERWPLTDWLRQADEQNLLALARHLASLGPAKPESWVKVRPRVRFW